MILPWRKPDLWAASPASRLKLLGRADRPGRRPGHHRAHRVLPVRVAVQRAYGVNNNDSLIYMGAMYVLALVIYLVARVIRSRQGIDLSLINKEIPVE